MSYPINLTPTKYGITLLEKQEKSTIQNRPQVVGITQKSTTKPTKQCGRKTCGSFFRNRPQVVGIF